MGSTRWIAAVLAICAFTTPAWAHKLTIFALADAMTIQGEVYHTPGGPVKNGAITVFGPSGETLQTLQTGEKGAFSFEANAAMDHRIVCESADGHEAEYTVKAEELGGMTSTEATPVETDPADHPPAIPPSDSDLDARIAAAVRHEIAPLREALAAQENALRLRDIIGGIGYIAGCAGLLVLIKTRRPKAGQ